MQKENNSNFVANQITALTVAKDYLSRSWQPLPVPYKSKNPNFDGWQHFRTENISQLEQRFNGKPQNIGVLLGSPSNGLIDIDLDSPEVLKIAELFLPETKAVFGRASRPRSHRLYVCEDAETAKFQFDSMLCEIRATGCQTVFPFSVHPSGERITWNQNGEPAQIDFARLRLAVGKLASAALISRFWTEGKRHDLALCISGALLKRGWTQDDIFLLIKGVCLAANDDDHADRLKTIETTAERLQNGANVKGLPSLESLTDRKAVSLFMKWLELESSTQTEAETSKPQSEAAELPKNFKLKDEGLFFIEIKKDDATGNYEEKETWLCSPLRVEAATSDADSNGWGVLVRFNDRKNIEHSLTLPMSLFAGDGAEIRARLMDAGLIVSTNSRNRQKILDYIVHSKPEKHILCVNQLGWHSDAFVFPDETISADEREILLQNVDRTNHKFKTNGSLNDWQEKIGKYCAGNSRLMFAVSTAFAASLLPIAGEPSGGFHIRGLSSTGKTTALLVAGSVWGGDARKGFLETWRATANGLEAVAEMHNNSLLLLDEISQVAADEIGEIVYCLSNGFGKSRMTRTTTARRKTEWQLLFLSTGEKSLKDLLSEAGQRSKGGQEARFVDLNADAGKGLGLFENLHSFNGSEALAKHLATASREFYGSPVREFLRRVVTEAETVKQVISETRRDILENAVPSDASGEVHRVASRFALVTAAGRLASRFGIVGWTEADNYRVFDQLFQEWLAARGTIGNMDITNGVRQVLAFMEAHGSSRFQTIDDVYFRAQNRVGFRRVNSIGDFEYLILEEAFKREVCKGYPHEAVANELELLGYFIRTEKDRKTQRVFIKEMGGKVPVYKFVFNTKDEKDTENDDF